MQHGAVRRIWKKRTPPHLYSRASMQRLWIFLKSIGNCGVSVTMCFIFPFFSLLFTLLALTLP